MLKKISYSALCLAIMGCSTSTSVLPTKEIKANSVKVNQITNIDLGNGNASAKANFNFGKVNTPFGIKNIDADLVGSIDCVKVNLQGIDNSSAYTVPPLANRNALSKDIPAPGTTFSVTFSGLKPSTDYYVSAEAYSNSSACTDFSSAVNETSYDGTSSSTLGGGKVGAVGYLASEEFISITSLGLASIKNEVAPFDNSRLDIEIQLRRSTNAASDGNVNIIPGQDPEVEAITSP